MVPVVNINGIEYPLDTTLRVAYRIQGANDHKPYSKVFSEIGDMLLEKQIEILYLAFQIANPEAAKTFNQQQFLAYYLEHFTLKEVMAQLEGVVKAILGDEEEPEVVTVQGIGQEN